MDRHGAYRWYILVLVVLNNMFNVAIPAMGVSVLSKEISISLGLSVVQVGLVWGMGFFPGIVTSLLGGAAGDKFGAKRVLVICSLLLGLAGAARGLVNDFSGLLLFSFLQGALTQFIMMNGFKAASQWFASHELGKANGIISAGMGLGLLLGALLSASVLSPLLGGWRNVLITYGLIGALMSVPWFFSRPAVAGPTAGEAGVSIWSAVRHVTRLRQVWLLGAALFGVSGAVQAVMGYLPLYLRNIGWNASAADGAISAFNLSSLLLVLPFTLWSDRLGSRKRLLIIAAACIMLGNVLLSIASGSLVWAAVVLAGCMRDGFMALFVTMVVETEGVGAAYSGTAVGFVMAVSQIGNAVAPPLGNSLAGLGPSAPFALWAGLALFGILCIGLTRRNRRAVTVEPAAP